MTPTNNPAARYGDVSWIVFTILVVVITVVMTAGMAALAYYLVWELLRDQAYCYIAAIIVGGYVFFGLVYAYFEVRKERLMEEIDEDYSIVR